MKKLFFLLILASFIYACVPEDHVLELEIVNNTSERIQNIKVFTAEERISFAADNLPAGEEIEHTMQIPASLADGQFTFRFTRSNGKEETATGSYLDDSEGALKKTLLFNIQDDGVNVEQKVLEVE